MAILQTLDVVEDLLYQPLLLLLISQSLNWLSDSTSRGIKHIEVLAKQEEWLFPLVLSQILDELGKLRKNLRVPLIDLDL